MTCKRTSNMCLNEPLARRININPLCSWRLVNYWLWSPKPFGGRLITLVCSYNYYTIQIMNLLSYWMLAVVFSCIVLLDLNSCLLNCPGARSSGRARAPTWTAECHGFESNPWQLFSCVGCLVAFTSFLTHASTLAIRIL